MNIKIQGQDYTAALDALNAVTIERTLNEPSTCHMWISLTPNSSLAIPARNQSLAVTGDDGTVYFTGYIAASPLPEYAGVATEGPRYRYALQAVSDEMLLDQLLMPVSKAIAGETAGPLLATLVAHSGSAALSTANLTLNSPISQFVPGPGTPWSKSAGEVANQARATYRAVNGNLSLESLPGQIHTLNETDGSLTLANLSFSSSIKRALANDVTVCGQHEPAAYVTEYFLGDGATTQFFLGAGPFFPPASSETIIHELFNEAAIDAKSWSSPSGTGYFSLGASGMLMAGGSGVEGATALSWLDPVEMGGTLLLEADGVTLAAGSTGVLAGFYSGAQTQAGCVAGFQITAQQGTGAVTLQPMVGGSLMGTAYTVNATSQYTLRIRVHCLENQRATAIYRSWGDNGAITTGGLWNSVTGNLLFEIEEFVDGVASMPVMLYDGTIGNLAGSCTVVAANSINLNGTMRALNLTQLGSGWVVSTPSGGAAHTRRVGTLAEAAECHFERSGKLAFYTGCVPAVGEQIAASYRSVGRAVGRAVNTASQQSLAQAGTSAVATWIGSVINPPARSSQDCRNAAATIVQASAASSALWSGTYRGSQISLASDVWPGDALALNAPSAGLNLQVVVRKVTASYHSSYPDVVDYVIAFANDWADDLAIKTSTTVPADAWLPAAANASVLANLTGFTVTSLNGTTVTVNTGATAPVGGGFEVRRRDFCFMAGEDPDLVMRSSEPNLTFSRQSANDRFYLRMYDGSTPPNYSEFSTALFINLPIGS